VKFTILRLLTHSELGMFHEYRRQRKERAKQRAINFDWDVVDRVFPAAEDSQRIAIRCRRLEDEATVVEVASWLKRQHKNWRFEGDCPTSTYYKFVDPGALFAMVVDAGASPAQAAWVVLPLGHPARTAILSHGESARLGRSAMVALYGEEGAYSHALLAEHYPQLFGKVESVPETPTPPDVESGEVAPDPVGLFEILARAGHNLASAVADLVDNSLSHRAKVIDITFPKPNEGGRWMCIRDDGDGMTPAGLREGMQIGRQRSYGALELGKFGYGLKGAAFSQADRLTVVSKASGRALASLTWDKAHLAKTRRWELLADPVAPEHEAVVALGDSGTAVLLTHMRPQLEPTKVKGETPYSQELAAIGDHLELVFHRYLEGLVPGREKVTIRLNGKELRPNNPMGHPLTKSYEERRIELPVPGHERAAVLSIHAFVTPNEAEFDAFVQPLSPVERLTERNRLTLNGRANDAQGFYFYRLHRLIKWGGWEDLFAKDEHTKLLRVAVDFDRLADEQLQVDISKQLIRLPLVVKDELLGILKVPRVEARDRYKKKVKPPVVAPPPKATTGLTAPAVPPAPTGGGASFGTLFGATGTPPALPTPSPPKKDKTLFRLVNSGSAAWERKAGFGGEHVEVPPHIPELVTLVKAIDKNSEAKAALFEFLRCLEAVDAPKLLASPP
jgi:hypothetical protein